MIFDRVWFYGKVEKTQIITKHFISALLFPIYVQNLYRKRLPQAEMSPLWLAQYYKINNKVRTIKQGTQKAFFGFLLNAEKVCKSNITPAAATAIQIQES